MRLHGTVLFATAVAIVSINASRDVDDDERMIPFKNFFSGRLSNLFKGSPSKSSVEDSLLSKNAINWLKQDKEKGDGKNVAHYLENFKVLTEKRRLHNLNFPDDQISEYSLIRTAFPDIDIAVTICIDLIAFEHRYFFIREWKNDGVLLQTIKKAVNEFAKSDNFKTRTDTLVADYETAVRSELDLTKKSTSLSVAAKREKMKHLRKILVTSDP